MLAVIADPVFDRSDSRFTTPATETGDKAQTQTIKGDDARSIEHLAENSGDKSGVTTIRMVIPRLPFTRQEANQLMALTPKGSSFRAIDFQASRATVLDPALSQYRYVHIATHGLLDTERPGLSALVFSMVDAEGKPQNGFLRANDIYNLKLPAELVVLERLPDRTRQRDQRRRTGRTDARFYVCGRGAGGRQFVERERQSDRRPDDKVLREDAEAGPAARGSTQSSTSRDVEAEAMAVALLLGRVHHAGRVAVRVMGFFKKCKKRKGEVERG